MDELSYSGETVLDSGETVLEVDLTDHPLVDDLTELERLAASIEQTVWRKTAGQVKALGVEVTSKGVLLTGRCSTYYTKQQAQHAAMCVSGGIPLTNAIQVV